MVRVSSVTAAVIEWETEDQTKRKATMLKTIRIEKVGTVVTAAALGCALLTGCGGGADEQVTYKDLQQTITTSCSLSSSCHASGSSAAGNLQLVGSDAYCNLVGATKGAVFLSTAKSTYTRRVVPGDPDKSFLYKKLTLTNTDPNFGTGMPQGLPLPAAEIEKFRRWIAQGAKDANGVAGPGTCN